MKSLFCVNKDTLLLIAGLVWLMAGVNVARLGLLSYGMIHIHLYYFVLTVIVFAMFGKMFYKITVKHTKRIMGYMEKQPFWCFFDKKGYIMMAIMMGGGIWLRTSGLVCNIFVAFFYSGLGVALAMAGVIFLLRYVRYHKQEL